jgi:L-alanine-DL-glutamate epimerase-like enolase superfamily enzyme
MLAAAADFRVPARRAAAPRPSLRFAGRKNAWPCATKAFAAALSEILAKTQGVELITPLFEGLRQAHPDLASLVTQQAQQAERSSAQRHWRIEIGCDICRRETYRQAENQGAERADQ